MCDDVVVIFDGFTTEFSAKIADTFQNDDNVTLKNPTTTKQSEETRKSAQKGIRKIDMLIPATQKYKG